LALFAYWNIVYWGTQSGDFPWSFAVPSGESSDASVFMLYWLITPIITILLMIELLYFLIKLLIEKRRAR